MKSLKNIGICVRKGVIKMRNEDEREIDADEIEKTIWYSEDSYENREPADEFKIAWRKET